MNNSTTFNLESLDKLRAEMKDIIDYAPQNFDDSGKLTRFDTDKPHNKCGWYVLHCINTGGVVATYGNWKTGITQKFISFPKPLTEEEKKEQQKKRKELEEARCKQAAILKAETERNHETARLKSVELWTKAQHASPNHPYLLRKCVGAYGIKQSGNLLLIPLMDAGGYLRNLQTIAPDGTKRFLKGGIKKGMFAPLGTLRGANHAYLCEGYATGASIFEAYEQPTICALDAGNLLPVAQNIRAKYPTLPITLVADNDRATAQKTGVNVGISKAKKVAESVPLVTVQVPQFNDDAPLDLSDFNDAINFYNSTT